MQCKKEVFCISIKVVSLFDGISCGRVALERIGYAVSYYAAFEIDKYARSISRYQYSDIIQYGDVLDADFTKFADMGIDLVIGGSPCTFWSIAKAQREIDKSGMGWKLFMRFVEAVRQIKPRYFLLENVASMPAVIKDFISAELGCEPIYINSALLSAQHRKRLYWTNITGIAQPEDKGILLKDIIDSGLSYLNKSYCITATYAGATFEQTLRDKKRTTVAEPFNALPMATSQDAGFFNAETPEQIGIIGNGGQGERIYSVTAKSVSMKSQGGGGGALTGLYKIDLPDGYYTIRKLTPIEAERCQTLPDNYTAWGIDHNGNTVKISNTQRYRGIGNGFTVDVIAHILSHMEH